MDLDAALAALSDGAHEVLGDGLLGLYLVGSFAIGAGDEHSDVDFLAVTRERLTPAQVSTLGDLHARLPDLPGYWTAHLEGSYAPQADLRSPMSVGRAWPYVDNGQRVLTLSDHDNTLHARWLLREHGIALLGPQAAALVAPVDEGALRAEMIGVARARAEHLEEDPACLTNGWYQPYLVLTLCRALYTTCTGRVTSKAAAAEWALAQVPAEFGELIRRAVADRPDPWVRVHQEADPTLAAPTRAFAWEVHRLIGAEALRRRTD
ncbi:aminoglycoside nucleotidyltransferase ANT9 [soil metagenome]